MATPYSTTVLVAPVTRDLTILPTVKEELGITKSDWDVLLGRLISEQSEVATKYCRRELAQATVIDYFRLGSGSYLPLIPSRRPVSSVTTLAEGETELVAATDYETDSATGFLWRLTSDARTYWPTEKIALTYVGGFELLTTLPRDIERAVLILIKQAWFERTRDPRAKSETVEGIGRTDLWVGAIPGTGALPSEATALLDPYRQYFI